MQTVTLLVCAMMALSRANGDEDTSANATVHVVHDANNTVLFAAKACPGGWTTFEGRCFFYETTKRSWAQAQLHCQSLSGNLASVHSAAEYNHLQQRTSEVAWIGGSDCQEASAWFWVDGTPLDYPIWCPSQPDNTREECCMAMNTGDGKCWDDVNCSNLHPSFCAKNP